MKKKLIRKIIIYLSFVLPAIIALVLFRFVPVFEGIRLSFLKASMIDNSRSFNGFVNYINVFKNNYFWRVSLNTISFTIVALILSGIIGFAAAFVLNTKMRGRGILRAINIVPWVAPPVVMSIIWTWIYSKYSPINDILLRSGLIKQPFDFLGNISIGAGPLTLPMISVIIVYAWIAYPFIMIMTLSGLQSIPIELYEASQIDGASTSQQLKYITFPLLKPLTIITYTLLFIWTFQYFNMNYLMTRGGPRGYTDVLSTHIYISAFSKFDFGYAAAAGVMMTLMLIIPSIYYINNVLKSK